MKDGGAAFPIQHQEDPRGNVRAQGQQGMSVRDYFAIHGGEPLQVDILAAAGMVQRPDGIYAKSDDLTLVAPGFNAWFSSLQVEERCALRAKVRFLMADAMLREKAGRA